MKKLRTTIFFILSLAAIFGIASCKLSTGKSKQLVIYTWEDMFPQDILSAFEKDNPGIKIVYKTFDENEEMLDELIRTDGGEYDIIIADDYIVEFVTHPDWALAQKLNKGKIENIDNIDYFYQHQFYDPHNEYTIPYGAGIQTIVYDPAKIKQEITGYKDLWDSSLKNSVGIIGNYRVVNGMALKAIDTDYNTIDTAKIRHAGEMLKSLAPNIRVIKDTGLEDDLIAGRISVAVMYTDQAIKSKQARPELKTVFPIEGIGFGIMAAFIPSKAPNPDAAHRFLDYILDPKLGARCFEYLGYYCTFKASQAHINPEMKKHLILPDLHSFEMIQNVSQEAEDEHGRIWVEFLAAVGD
ncbi:MAG: spermidine/putrescine ABC transporter substrate-binding protein [Treponema sp.]|jgi:spermidine/putrescine-binding protein|nr:spermidine/putrescine ABC transporter substrate-binding protein [Treponema sp.]